MKTQTQIPGSPSRTPSWLGWLLIIPLLTLTLPAQATGPELTIQQSTNGTYLLSWLVTTNSYIVLAAPDVGGPWEPCREPVVETAGTCCMTVAATHQCEYFRLVEGYYCGFEDGDLEEWTVYTPESQAPTYLSWETTNGALRVYGTWPGTDLDRNVYFGRANPVMSDFTASIDILGWDDGAAGVDQANVGLVGRLTSYPEPPDTYAYHGSVATRQGGDPDKSALWFHEIYPGGWGIIGSVHIIPKADPAKDYRLEFSCVGTQLTVRLWELTNGTKSHDSYSYNHTAGTLTEGWFGFRVVVNGPNGHFDFTLDNFVIYATP